MSKIKEQHILSIYGIMFGIIIATILIFMLNTNYIQKFTPDYIDFSDCWVTDSGESADLSHISGSLTVHTTLPTLREDDVLYMNVKTANISVYLEDKCLYQSEVYNPHFFGYTAGSYFVRVPFETGDSGKQLTMIIDNPYHDGSGKITQIRLGEGCNMLISNLEARFSRLCISIIIVFIGIIFMVLFIPMWKKHSTGKELLYFGLFSFSIGVFMLTDSKLMQELFQNAHIYHVISEMFMLLIIIPILLFFESMYYNSKLQTKITHIICLLSALVFVVSYTLAITGIKDYHESIRLTHITYGIAIVFIIIPTASGILHKQFKYIYHYIGLICLCVGALLDMVIWSNAANMDTSFFTRIGTLLFMCLEATQVLSQFLAQYRVGIRSQLLEQLAYQDGLTELLNRTSYIEDIHALEHTESSDDILIAFFDVNNLKPINDIHGHAAGDQLLVAVANILRNCFSNFAKCYRIGGDEFVIITIGKDLEPIFHDACKHMNEELHKMYELHVFPYEVSVASGYSICHAGTDNLNDIIKQADANMYENKRKMKESGKFFP